MLLLPLLPSDWLQTYPIMADQMISLTAFDRFSKPYSYIFILISLESFWNKTR
jgi:hypothetical protein